MRFLKYNVEYSTEEGGANPVSFSYYTAYFPEHIESAAELTDLEALTAYNDAHEDGLITTRTVTTEEVNG